MSVGYTPPTPPPPTVTHNPPPTMQATADSTRCPSPITTRFSSSSLKSSQLYYAESSVRNEPPHATTAPTSHPPPPHRALQTRHHEPLYFTQTPYPTQPPRLREIHKGVCHYGQHVVYTPDHPRVQAIIKEANATWCLPQNVPEHFMALAALQVFYFPNSPVHWLFWSDERKKDTARLVNGIALKQPPVIHCSQTSWNGSEYLHLLYGVHSASHQLEDQEWFTVLVPKKEKELTRAQTLRTRKRALLADVSETSGGAQEQVADDAALEPPRKRSRTKRTENDRKAPSPPVESTPVKSSSPPVCDAGGPVAFPTLPSTSQIANPPSTCSILSSLPETSENLTSSNVRRTSSRRRQPKMIFDAAPESSTSSVSSRAPSVIPTPPAPHHSRTRSTSQSSAETLVASRRSRSMSRSSADTVVPAGVSKKGKDAGKTLEEAIDVDGLVDIDVVGPGPDLCGTESQPAEGMVTRSKRLRSGSDALRAASVLTDTSTREPSVNRGEDESAAADALAKALKTAPKRKRTAKKASARS
ncbi:hypothetical protein HGRIS_002611 [Hohenbuehelia grisea]|uniref:Uncharacterized protein n=1 Tax=Hohenbuehelia grisea TaxID=104357 RepID=A0ABR3JKY8_9AGAR